MLLREPDLHCWSLLSFPSTSKPTARQKGFLAVYLTYIDGFPSLDGDDCGGS